MSPLERTVILLAARPCERAMPRQKPAWCWRWMFGHPAPKPLANARLEALRRLAACIHASPSRQAPEDVINLCRDSGWSPDKIDGIVAFIRGSTSQSANGARPAVVTTAAPSRPLLSTALLPLPLLEKELRPWLLYCRAPLSKRYDWPSSPTPFNRCRCRH